MLSRTDLYCFLVLPHIDLFAETSTPLIDLFPGTGIQTYFNLYGTVPSEQIMVEWLGTSYEDKIPEYLDQMKIA